jgi:hypothetical protein
MTASCGFVWSVVNTMLSSFEMDMRCVAAEMGMTDSVLRAAMSSTETVPGPTFAV